MVLTAVPGVPVDLQVAFKGKSSSTVRVSWSPPSLANGIILDYQVHYEGYKAGEKQHTVSVYKASDELSVYPLKHLDRWRRGTQIIV